MSYLATIARDGVVASFPLLAYRQKPLGVKGRGEYHSVGLMGLSKKQLTGSDIFQRTAIRFGDWCQRNFVRIAMVVVPTVILIIAVLVVQLYMDKQKSNRLDLLASIDNQNQQADIDLSQQLKDMQTRIDTLTKSDKEDDKNSAEDLRKQLEQLKTTQEEQSYTRYHDFFQQHQQHAEGWAAGMQAVGIALQSQRYDDAKAILTTILQHTTGQQFHQTQGRILYIKVLEESGDLDAALAEVDKAYATISDEYRPSLLLIKARILLAKDQSKQAAAVYEQIIADFADAPEASRARTIMMAISDA
ncbi:MAG: hypothetical protein OYH77_01355 [Pseudomonadota bacterium]|nr:hypothetical protein [Pseudomonadota bacterium]